MSHSAPWILGLSTGWHNGAACLCRGSEIVVAMQEERLTRFKRAAIQPESRSLAVSYCLDAAGITSRDLALIVDCRIARTASEPAPGVERLFIEPPRAEVLHIPHHLGHAMSVFATSGFEAATVMVIDGSGSYAQQLTSEERAVASPCADTDVEHLSVYHIAHDELYCLEKHMSDVSYLAQITGDHMPTFRTLGHMFGAAAHQIFGDFLEAGKVMALAPCGTATFPADQFVTFDGRTFQFSERVPIRFPHGDRWPSRQQEYADLAASTQAALESALSQFVRHLPKTERLCYAGGVALNSVANHTVLRRAGFRDLFIIPAAEDSGVAIGAAYYGLRHLTGRTPSRRLRTDALGRSYSNAEVDDAVADMPAVVTRPTGDVIARCADLLCDGRIVAWFQGGAEFGPRALGHRSILCDPRRPDAKEVLNFRVKHRESFRPFAPAILAEQASRWFDTDGPNHLTDFMLEICQFRETGSANGVPAVTHVDNSGRLQTVTAEGNRRFHALIEAFYERTGVPMIVNTSMNVMGEPIVESPRDALGVLLFTGIDTLVIEDRVIERSESLTSVLQLVPSRTAFANDILQGRETVGIARIPLSQLEELRVVLDGIDGTRPMIEVLRDAVPRLEDSARAQTDVACRLFRYGMIDFQKVALRLDLAR
jgi:carbamoyltransferase